MTDLVLEIVKQGILLRKMRRDQILQSQRLLGVGYPVTIETQKLEQEIFELEVKRNQIIGEIN